MSQIIAGIARLLVLIPADRVPHLTPVNQDKTDAENLREDWQRIGMGVTHIPPP